MAKKSVLQEVQNNRMLELYSEGHSYGKIKHILSTQFDHEFSNRELGERMGELKKEMGCATQFEMGCRFAENKLTKLFESEFDYKVKHVKETSYLQGYIASNKEMESYYNRKVKAKIFEGMIYAFVISALAYGFEYILT